MSGEAHEQGSAPANSRTTGHAGDGEGNGNEGRGNSGQEGRHDATVRLEGRRSSGHGAAGWSLCGDAAQVGDEGRIRGGPDWTGRVCEGITADQAGAGTSGEEQSSAGEVYARSASGS